MLLSLLLSACVHPGTASDFFLAQGAEWTVDPDTVCDRLSCRMDEVDEIVDVIPQVAGVVDVETIDPTVFTLRGTTHGDTRVAISGMDDGNNLVERYMDVHVAPVTKAVLALRCDAYDPAEAPWILPVGASISARWFFYDDEHNALEGLPALDAPGVTWSELNESRRSVNLTMPDEPGEIEVGSELTPDIMTRLRVITEDQYDGFEAELWPAGDIVVGEGRRIWSAMLHEGDRVCLDDVRRVLSTSTPEICLFGSGVSEQEIEDSFEPMGVYGVATGLCRIEVSVPDYGWSESLTLSVNEAE